MGRYHLTSSQEVAHLHVVSVAARRNYHCYMEPRAEDLAALAHLRSVRQKAVDSAAGGDIATVLSHSDAATQCVYVVKLLDVHPSLGKVAGRRLLASLGLNHFSRISDLSPRHIETILSACGVHA